CHPEPEQRAGDQTSDDDHRDRMEDFLSGLVGRKHQRNEPDTRSECSHQDRYEAFLRATDHHRLAEFLALVLHEMEIVREQHDAIPRGHPGHRNEADERGDADIVQLEIGEYQPANQGQWDITEHLDREEWRPKIAVEQERYDHEDHRAEDGNP